MDAMHACGELVTDALASRVPEPSGRRRGAVVRGVERLRDRGVVIDILVANAGAQNRKAVLDMPLADWQALMDVHVNGAFNCVRACLPAMLERGFGRIVLMSSVAGQAALPNVAAYATAKR